ncbi:SRPBCC family protein [Falsiroseomonas sp. HC035]|uniref:SRPBCC family protein n=1 Tax=Falsiroseomonas sp. HC035 TaxID=3390999 RepID=UPI003D310401
MTQDEEGALDLVFTREVPISPGLVWEAWTRPEHLVRWFTPAPWRTLEAEVDLRPGGIFRTVMQGPAGERFDNVGCWLEVVPHQRLVWTDALAPGWRPSAKPFVTAILTLEAVAEGTLYTARVLHKDAADRDRHAAMGFQVGWGKALDQLVALMREGAA